MIVQQIKFAGGGRMSMAQKGMCHHETHSTRAKCPFQPSVVKEAVTAQHTIVQERDAWRKFFCELRYHRLTEQNIAKV
jgi:hypothetical protein